MSDPITQIIVWLSPFLAAGFLWFLNNHITDVKDEITQLKGKIGGISNEIQELKISSVKIQSDLEHIKESVKIEKEKADKFENHVVKVLRDAKGRFK